MRARGLLASTLVLGALLLVAALAAFEPISGLAPVQVVLDGRQELVGVAMADGTLYVSDRGAGIVYRRNLEPPGQPTEAVAGLDRPAGLAVDRDGRLLIAEEKAGRVLRLEFNGTLSVLATGIKKPRWLAVSPDGAIYVSAHRRQPPGRADETEGREILRLVPGGSLTVVASGIRRLEGLARLSSAVVAATRGLESGPESAGMLLWYPVLDDGSLGAPLTWVDTGLKQPVGLVLDWLGALYVSSKELAVGIDTAKRAVGKVHPDARLSTFAEHFEDPQGVALGPEGSLYVADGNAGRLLRFRAPAGPALKALPELTNQSSFPVGGVAEPAARMDLFVNDAATPVTGASEVSGAFSLTVPLTPNAENSLHVFATTHAGDGLTSAPARAILTHDSVPPGVAFREPPPGVFVRQTVGLEVEATDGGSSVASLALSKAGQPLAATLVPAPPAASVRASAALDTTAVADGTHTLTAAATDRAGNSATASRSVFVDNTPPDTMITDGPTGTVSETAVNFTVAGSDNLTPPGNLKFAWGLDGGPFFPFSPETRFSLTGLSPSPHTVRVKARDLAGNEDPTPAQRTFTVAALGVQITTPADGATLTPGLILVRGTVEAGGAEAGVVVNDILAAVQGTTFAALVSVTPETASLTARATSAAGATATHSVAITVVPTLEPAMVLLRSPQSGVAPLTVAFSLLGGPLPTQVELDFDGNGTVDFTGPSLEGQTFTYPQAGLYLPRVTVTDAQGTRHTASAVVRVYDRTALDTLLQAKWTGLKDTLRTGEIARAVTLIHTGTRVTYQAQFIRFSPTTLANIDRYMTTLQLVEVGPDGAQYEMLRARNGQTLSFAVWFQLDQDGLWRLRRF